MPQDASADWWDIGSFWVSIIALLVSIVVGTAAVWVSYRMSVPRRRLVIAHSTQPLPDFRRNPRRLGRGVRVSGLHLVEMTIGNDGRRSIPGNLFDQGRPIVVDVAAPIIGTWCDTRRAPSRRRLQHTEEALSPGVNTHGHHK
ncbi:hypothetical protein, partial [Actinoplanes sp. URMC 104]|uniref:hypothetical protein n=1 Tax=Actinoplanes sp. URMC 104 TaxID=3423409 RepID=UPI003F1B0821